MKKYLPVVLFLFLALIFAAAGLRGDETSVRVGGLVVAALFVFLAYRRYAKLKKEAAPPAAAPDPVPQPAPAADSRPRFEHLQFTVAGVTFKNDDGSDRQTILRHLRFGDAPYARGDSFEVSLEPYDYQGSPAVRVLVNGYQVGNAPHDKVPAVLDFIKSKAEVSAVDIYGGGTKNGEKLSYGCQITLRRPG